MTVRDLIREGERTLMDAQVLSPRLDCEYLLAEALKTPRLNLLLSQTEQVAPADEQAFRLLLARRAQHEPLQYILGQEDFYGLTFHVAPGVLIPRADTETLCEKALEVLPGHAPRVLDLCTGSGALAVTLQHLRPDAQVYASDLSPDALSIARENARRNHASVTFLEGDLFAPLQNMFFDVIVSNPPYISRPDMASLQEEVLQEPHMALYGGEDGLNFYRRIAKDAPLHLAAGGWLCLEIGDTQSADVTALLQPAFEHIETFHDLSGKSRVVRGRLKPR